MKKCIIMFVFLVLTIVIAKLTDNHKQDVVDHNYAVNSPHEDQLLAKAKSRD